MAAPNVERIAFNPDAMNRYIACIARNTEVPVGCSERAFGLYIEFEDVNGRVVRVAVDRESVHIDPDNGDVVAVIHNFKPQWNVEKAWISIRCRGEFHRIAELQPPQGKPVFEKGEVYDFEVRVNFAPLEARG